MHRSPRPSVQSSSGAIVTGQRGIPAGALTTMVGSSRRCTNPALVIPAGQGFGRFRAAQKPQVRGHGGTPGRVDPGLLIPRSQVRILPGAPPVTCGGDALRRNHRPSEVH